MIWPEKFDQNEWFILVFLIIMYAVVFLTPKRFPISTSILVMLFAATVGRVSDHLLSAPQYNLYNIMDQGKYEIFDMLTYILYGAFAYILVYIYDKLGVRHMWTLLYIVVCSVLSVLFESISLTFDVFLYNKWKPIYSLSYYLVMEAMTIYFFNSVNKLQTKKTK
ncbi:hypothetical protein [Aquibacillus kalidii]|uniref:hypothetical protein n=1 Tax=Aquibacillus kalidii TaxID=2762597 RepID=UPI00164432CF|nr:hypothetical protein [Aquibacillus kalidii]